MLVLLLSLVLALGPRGIPAQVDCSGLTPTDLTAYVGYMTPQLEAIGAQAPTLQAQATQLAGQASLLRDPAWLTTARETVTSLRAAGLALQQYPSVPPTLQPMDTLLTSAGDHLVTAMDDWTGGLDDEDGDQLSDAAVGLQRFAAELSAAGTMLSELAQCR